jgi:hypothetical protein
MGRLADTFSNDALTAMLAPAKKVMSRRFDKSSTWLKVSISNGAWLEKSKIQSMGRVRDSTATGKMSLENAQEVQGKVTSWVDPIPTECGHQ